jgi:hypothetical protein
MTAHPLQIPRRAGVPSILPMSERISQAGTPLRTCSLTTMQVAVRSCEIPGLAASWPASPQSLLQHGRRQTDKNLHSGRRLDRQICFHHTQFGLLQSRGPMFGGQQSSGGPQM